MIMEEMRMRNYALTIEDDVITHIADTDPNGTPIPGILHLPKEATAFSPDVWACLGCHFLSAVQPVSARHTKSMVTEEYPCHSPSFAQRYLLFCPGQTL